MNTNREIVLDDAACDDLLLGATITGSILDLREDTLRIRAADGNRWELAVHLLDVSRFGTVARLERADDGLRLLDDTGEQLVSVVHQPTPARSWDTQHWAGRRCDLAADVDPSAVTANAILRSPDAVVRLGIASKDTLDGHLVAVSGSDAVWIEEDDDDLDVIVFASADLALRVLEVAGLLDPFSLTSTVDLLITAPISDGRTRVTTLEWTVEQGGLWGTDENERPIALDPGVLTAEITDALRPFNGLGDEPRS